MGTMTTAQWNQDATTKITMALKVLRLADSQSQAHARAYFKSTRDGSQHRNKFKAMHADFHNTHKVMRLGDQLKELVKATEKVLWSLKRSLADQRTASSSSEDQLRVCIYRSQMREKRPLQERVQDGCEAGLERERHVLQKAHDDLKEQMRKTAEIIPKVEEVLEQLRDEEYNMVSIGGDENPRDVKVAGSNDPAANGPGVISSRKSQKTVKLTIKEEERLQSTSELVKRAKELEHKANNLLEQSQDMIKRFVSDAGRANRMVVAELTKRISETQAVKKRLEFLLSETEARLKEKNRRLTWKGPEGQVFVLEEKPIKIQKARETATKKKGKKYAEPDSGELDQVVAAPIGMDGGKFDGGRGLNANASQKALENMRDELQLELNNKTTALQIDVACQRAKCVDSQVVVPFNTRKP